MIEPEERTARVNHPKRAWYVPDVVLLSKLVGIHAILFGILRVVAYLMGLQREPSPLWAIVLIVPVLLALVRSLRLAVRMTRMALLSAVVVVYAVFFVVRHVIAYLTELQQGPLVSWTIVFVVLALLTLALSLGLVIRMILSWPKHILDMSRRMALCLLATVGMTVFLVLPFTRFGWPPHRTFIKGWQKFVIANVDLDSIRAWLGTRGPKACSDYVYDLASGATIEDWWPDAAPWAKTFTPLDPHYAMLCLDDNGHPAFCLGWFGGWGLIVGSKDMPMPPSCFAEDNEYRLPVDAGAYAWHE